MTLAGEKRDSAEHSAMVALLGGAVQFVRFQKGPDIGGKAGDFKDGDPVWLSLDCPIANPFTGEKAVFVEALVVAVVPQWGITGDLEQHLQVLTVRHSRLAGAVPASRLRHRRPGEIAPGRMQFGPGA